MGFRRLFFAVVMTVLCVDDDRSGLATVARALRDVAPIATARSAAEAETALAPEVAVVVSDYRMPGTNGAELLATVRSRDDTIGRILLTAYADAEILMEAINRGHVQRYLAKPWDPRELRAAVRHAIAAAEAARERRRLAADIAQAYERLRESDALKTRFLTVAAHELRTPLHVLGGVLEALADATAADPDAGELLAVAARNLGWLRRSVRAMTDLARLAQPERRPHAGLCVAALVDRAATEVASSWGPRVLLLSRRIVRPAPVVGDAADLHHAIVNLLLNAVRFTPDGGAIDVAVERAGAAVRVVVADTGVGIALEAQPHVGEPFFTAAPADHHHSDAVAFGGGGIGLGLAVARAVAADHGGQLTFTSEPGRGAAFVLELPASDDAAGG